VEELLARDVRQEIKSSKSDSSSFRLLVQRRLALFLSFFMDRRQPK